MAQLCVSSSPTSLPPQGAFLATVFLVGFTTPSPTSKLSSGDNRQSQRCPRLAPQEQDGKHRALTDVL